RVQRLDDAVTVHVVVATHRVGSTLGVRVLRLGAGRVRGAVDGDVPLGGALRAVVAWRAVVDVTVDRHGSPADVVDVHVRRPGGRTLQANRAGALVPLDRDHEGLVARSRRGELAL